MKIAVLGAGAMGSIFGARFHDAGHDVTLVDVSERLVRKIVADGVTVIDAAGPRVSRVHATTDPNSIGVVDLLVFFVKCYHTSAAVHTARSVVGDNTVVASLQNGWGNGDLLAAEFGSSKVALGVTYNSGTVREPAVVAHTNQGKTVVGPYDGESLEVARPLVQALEDARLDVESTLSVKQAIWKKLVLNAATLPTAALTGLTGGELGQPGEMLDLVDAVTREAVAVARSEDVQLDPGAEIETIHAICERVGDGKASMLQDIEAGRRTEVDVITGAIVRSADVHGVEVPCNRSLYALIKGFERAHGLI